MYSLGSLSSAPGLQSTAKAEGGAQNMCQGAASLSTCTGGMQPYWLGPGSQHGLRSRLPLRLGLVCQAVNTACVKLNVLCAGVQTLNVIAMLPDCRNCYVFVLAGTATLRKVLASACMSRAALFPPAGRLLAQQSLSEERTCH